MNQMIRLRMAWRQHKNIQILMMMIIFAWLLLAILLHHMPNESTYDPLTSTEALTYPDPETTKWFNGKCPIKNFETLRHMSIVYTWVNGSQPCYREMRATHGGKNAIGGSRDREIGELMYSIRSFQKYVKWHNGPIYIVTPGHIPNWINLDHPRIHLINQDDLFPDYAKQFLPTFNTHVIEQFLYLIPGLSDIYMQINDDYIFTKSIDPHEFFTCDGGIRLLHENGLISHTPPTAKKGIWISSVLNTQQEMDLRWGIQDRQFIKHAPFVYSRKAFERIHQIFNRPLYMTLKSKFRSKQDMNNPLLHHYYLLVQGSMELNIPIQVPPEEEMQGYKLILMQNDNIERLKEEFENIIQGTSPYKIIALNDEYSDMKVAETALDFFQRFLPEPSEFEKKIDSPSHPLTIRKPITCQVDETILPPFPKRIEASPKYQMIGYREIRWIVFTISFLKGIGIGMGFLFVYLWYRMLQPGTGKINYTDHV